MDETRRRNRALAVLAACSLTAVLTSSARGSDEALRSAAVQSFEQHIPRYDSNHDVSGPAWSPDGSKIAFVSTGLGGSQLEVMRSDGSGKRVLARGVVERFEPPVWSPDGSTIAFLIGVGPC